MLQQHKRKPDSPERRHPGPLSHPAPWAALACAMLAGSVQAQNLVDPTRPSRAFLAAQTQGTVAGASAEAAGSTSQILVLSRDRKFAMVDGQKYKVGDSYNGAQIVRLDAGGIVVQKDGRTERLGMNATVDKHVRARPPEPAGKIKAGKSAANGESQ